MLLYLNTFKPDPASGLRAEVVQNMLVDVLGHSFASHSGKNRDVAEAIRSDRLEARTFWIILRYEKGMVEHRFQPILDGFHAAKVKTPVVFIKFK